MFGAWQQGFGYFISFRDALVLLIIILIAVVAVVVMRQRQMRKGRKPSS